MNETRESFGGFYHPAFFRMNIPTVESLLDLNALPEHAWPFYFHEYIHFLQDISTSDGLVNASSVINYIRYAIQATKDGVSLPLTVLPDAVIMPQQQLRKLYLGANLGRDPKDDIFIDVRLVDSALVLPTGQTPKQVLIYFASGETFQFGSFWLGESMAYIAENMVYPDAEAPNHVAYYSAEWIANYLYPELAAQSRYNVLALCDASLLFWHPGQIFYLLLKQMRHQSWLPESPEDIYDFAQKTIEFDYHGIKTIDGLLTFSAAQAIDFVSSTFTSDSFAANAAWIREVILRAELLRNKRVGFILELVRGGPMKTNKYFAEILRWLGTPFTTNNNDEESWAPMNDFEAASDLHPNLFRAMRQILVLFMGGERRCEMKSYCQQSCYEQDTLDITDERCTRAPWERSKDQNRCAFGVMWKMWGLEDIEPQFRIATQGF